MKASNKNKMNVLLNIAGLVRFSKIFLPFNQCLFFSVTSAPLPVMCFTQTYLHQDTLTVKEIAPEALLVKVMV